MNSAKASYCVVGLIALAAAAACAQSVTFNTPVDWMTLNTGGVEAQAIFDTAAIGGKTVTVTGSIESSGGARAVGSARVRVSEPSADLALGTVSRKVVGGTDFLRLAWSVSGTDEQGEIAPVGIVQLEALPEYDDMRAVKVEEGADVAAIVERAGQVGFIGAGAVETAFLWDSTRLLLAVKKGGSEEDEITFAVDGKNGKYAFLAYSDRFIRCFPSNDSLETWHTGRSWAKDSLAYQKEKWHNEIACNSADGVSVVEVPWYDLGMVPPFVGRRIGFAAFGSEGNDDALPETARRDIPGTWGNLAFVEKP